MAPQSEGAYEECLCWELSDLGIIFQRQVPLPLHYKDVRLDIGYRVDVVVEGRLVVELKTVDALTALHQAQLLTYLKLGGYTTGLLLNFNVPLLRAGIKRMVV